MSMLSDISAGVMDQADVNKRCNFIKFLMQEYKDNFDVEIDSDHEYGRFRIKHPNLA
jgi:hypothetical protein